jgi:hypothetical protein
MAIFTPTAWAANENLLAVLLLVAVGQQIWAYLAQGHSRKREELFRIITENYADMIALVMGKEACTTAPPSTRFWATQPPNWHKLRRSGRFIPTTVSRSWRRPAKRASLGSARAWNISAAQERHLAHSGIHGQHYPQRQRRNGKTGDRES